MARATRSLERKVNMYRGKKVIIYGLGKEFQDNKSFLETYFHVVGYSDRHSMNGDRYIEPNRLRDQKYQYIYITSLKYYKEIKNSLINDYSIPEERILWEIDLWKEQIEISAQNGNSISDLCLGLGDVHVDIKRFISQKQNNMFGGIEKMPTEGPEVYNADGKRMETFFIKDNYFAEYPYWASKYFMWDRYNWGLNTHFYSHCAIMNTIGKPTKKYGLFTEPRSITPKDYELIEKRSEILSEFDAFFTFDEKVLNKFPNAKFVPFGAEPWYGRTKKGKEKITDNYKNKTKNISMIASDKGMCEGHLRRKKVAMYCKKNGLADTFGQFDGGSYVETIEDVFEEYRYSIVMENDISAYYFTEKLTSCFAAQTVPVYLGATKVSEFFNTDGMIILSLKDIDHIEDVLRQCNEKDYESRIPAILDNYQRVQKYQNIWDFMYERYF